MCGYDVVCAAHQVRQPIGASTGQFACGVRGSDWRPEQPDHVTRLLGLSDRRAARPQSAGIVLGTYRAQPRASQFALSAECAVLARPRIQPGRTAGSAVPGRPTTWPRRRAHAVRDTGRLPVLARRTTCCSRPRTWRADQLGTDARSGSSTSGAGLPDRGRRTSCQPEGRRAAPLPVEPARRERLGRTCAAAAGPVDRRRSPWSLPPGKTGHPAVATAAAVRCRPAAGSFTVSTCPVQPPHVPPGCAFPDPDRAPRREAASALPMRSRPRRRPRHCAGTSISSRPRHLDRIAFTGTPAPDHRRAGLPPIPTAR